MAGNSLVGALRVSLGLDSAQFEAGTKKAQRTSKSAGKDITASFKRITVGIAAVTAAATAMAAAIAVPVKKAIDNFDDLSKAAQRTGTSVEDLAKLRFGAGLSGVDAKTLETALGRLNVALGDMGRNAAPEASRALASLGVQAGSTTLEAVRALADRFAAMPDGVEKSAAAIKIFGRSGAALIPLLNQGSEGINQMSLQAAQFGLVIDKQTAVAAENFNDNLTRLSAVMDGITNQVAAGLLPTLSTLTDELLNSANGGRDWVEVGRVLGRALVNIAEVVWATGDAFKALGGFASASGRAVRAAAVGDFAIAAEILRQSDRQNVAMEKSRAAFFDRLRQQINAFEPDGSQANSGGPARDIETAATAAAKAVRELTAAQMRLGYGDTIKDITGGAPMLSAGMQTLLADAKNVGAVLKNEWAGSFETLKVDLPTINGGLASAFMAAERFGDNLARGLGQALVFGQSLGDALVNSIRAAAAELVTSGLLSLLTGKGGSGGGLVSAIGGLFGFANGTPSMGAPGGLAMVGERGRELVGLPQGAKVWNNRETERMMSGAGGGGETRVLVDVQPSPLFVTTVAQTSATAGAQAAAGIMARQGRSRIPGAAR